MYKKENWSNFLECEFWGCKIKMDCFGYCNNVRFDEVVDISSLWLKFCMRWLFGECLCDRKEVILVCI